MNSCFKPYRKMSARTFTRRRVKRGAVLVCVVACLAVAMLIVAVITQYALRSRFEARAQRDWMQVRYLVDAGAGRALRKLAENADYQGETWTFDLENGEQTEPSEVQILVGEDFGKEAKREIQIIAKLIDRNTPERSMQASRTFHIPSNSNLVSSKEPE